MELQRLIQLGFTPIAGNLDYQGQNYGTFNADGVFLTAAGAEKVESLLAVYELIGSPEEATEEVVVEKRRPGRPRKAE